jgi:hypothetical protein
MNKKSQIFVILGMHKSGTTLISDILHQSGINMVESNQHDISYDTGSKAERLLTKEINNKVLNSEDLYSLKIKNQCKFDSVTQTEIQDLIETLNNAHECWGFKDPRTCFTYHYWNTVIPIHKIIVVFRNPSEVWLHYWQESKWKRKAFIFLSFFHSWCEHNEQILKCLAETSNNFIVIEYSQFMNTEDGIKRLQKFLNRNVVDRRKKQLYRNSNQSNLFYMISKFIYKIRTGKNPDDIYNKLSLYQH